MNRFIEAVKNMFRIPDLRNRVLFTLALLAVYRIGAHIPIPGINTAVLDQLFNQAARLGSGHFRSVQRRQFPPHDDFRAGHHAVHHLVHHPAVDDRGVPVPRAAAKGRRARPAQDYAVHALSDDRAEHRAVASIAVTLAAQASDGQSLVYHPGLRLHDHDRS